MKTHKGTAKRARITRNGKVMIRLPNPKRNKRRRTKLYEVRQSVVAHESLADAVKTNLPYD